MSDNDRAPMQHTAGDPARPPAENAHQHETRRDASINARTDARADARTDAPRGSNPLFRSWSFRLALLTTILAGGWWASDTLFHLGGAATSYAPGATKLGLSFACAAVIGMVLRKIIKLTLWVAATVAVVLGALKFFGFIKLDFASIQHSVDEAMTQTRTFAQHASDTLLGYLPSAGASWAGLWRGSKRDSVR